MLGFSVVYLSICRGRLSARSGWFAAAMLVLAAAFVTPLGALSRGYLFSAHMIQHLLLLLIVPLFLMLSLPVREGEARSPGSGKLGRGLPVLGWMAGLGAMWFWHVPSLCSAATESTGLGMVRSATFLLAGLAFWLPIYAPSKPLRMPPLSAVVYLFSACLGCTLLGIYITFTSISVCPAFANPTDTTGVLGSLRAAGLSAPADQQLGGLLMWVSALLALCLRHRERPLPLVRRGGILDISSLTNISEGGIVNQDERTNADRVESKANTPRPTYAPAAMAMGVMMLLWGIVTMWIMSAAGAGLMAWSLWTWIREISLTAD